jgi:hypothetical protein
VETCQEHPRALNRALICVQPFLITQSAGDAPAEQKSVKGALVLVQHVVARACAQTHTYQAELAGAVVVHGVKQIPTFVRGAVPDDGAHAFPPSDAMRRCVPLPLIHPLQHLARILAAQATKG